MNDAPILSDDDPLSPPSMPTLRGGDPDTLGRIDHYDLLRKLGGGGFGVVYLARDTAGGVDVALKTLHPLLKRNAEEMDVLREKFKFVSRLSHPNIAAALVIHPVRDVDVRDAAARAELDLSPGDSVMVMRYAPGVTLSRWNRQFPDGVVPPDLALGIGRQVAAALDYAHGERIVHRDVKPGNIMVETQEGGRVRVRILDFGLAAEIRSSMSRVSTERGDTSGTRPYMAPEQWVGGKQDGRTDQYALACVLYELLSGAPPFASVFETGDFRIMQETVERRIPAPVAGLGPAANAALLRALAKTPAARFPSCTAFVDALEGAMQAEKARRGRPRKNRLRAAAIAGAAVLAAVLVLSTVPRTGKVPVSAPVPDTGAPSGTLPPAAPDDGAPSGTPAAPAEPLSAPDAEVPGPAPDAEATAEAFPAPDAEPPPVGYVPVPEETAAGSAEPSGDGPDGNPPADEDPGWTIPRSGPVPVYLDDGTPLEMVRCSRAAPVFWMGETEVSQEQWKAVAGGNPSRFKGAGLPVENVSWNDCSGFVAKLNASSAAKRSGLVFRLPSAPEWQLACRAGAEGDWCRLADGTEISGDTLGRVAWFAKNSAGRTRPCGRLESNAWGLRDMLGNVLEWTATADDGKYVVCGGGWLGSAGKCTATNRLALPPDDPRTKGYFGFRLCADGGRAAERREDAFRSLFEELVRIPGTDCLMGRFEVSQAQWEAVAGGNPSRFKDPGLPVENVSWEDCTNFVARLNRSSAAKESGLVFRLPTEEEWRLACRAGSQGGFCRLEDGTDVSAVSLDGVAWFADNSGRKTHPRGRLAPNAWGFCDMLGNVAEWTSAAEGGKRVLCGGSWISAAEKCSSSFRLGWEPSVKHGNGLLGFRVCADIPAEKLRGAGTSGGSAE